jgi:hypothetical protein
VQKKCRRFRFCTSALSPQVVSTEGGTRTHTPLRAPDFESGTSAIPSLRRVWSHTYFASNCSTKTSPLIRSLARNAGGPHSLDRDSAARSSHARRVEMQGFDGFGPPAPNDSHRMADRRRRRPRVLMRPARPRAFRPRAQHLGRTCQRPPAIGRGAARPPARAGGEALFGPIRARPAARPA